MSYEIIEKNEYGVLVCSSFIPDNCEVCKYQENEPQNNPCKGCNLAISWYLTDQEAAKLETETASQKELIDLHIENKQLKERIETLESDKSTELITKHEGSFYEETVTKCCGIGMITNENFCPNCGRKIVRK